MRGWSVERPRAAARDALLGAAAGMVGTALMEPVMRLASRLQRPASRSWEESVSKVPAPQVLVQRLGARAHLVVSPEAEARAGLGVHWAYGALLGAGYALLRRRRPGRPLLAGLLFGAALWLLGDEGLVPALHLSPPPEAFPGSTHAKALAAHLAYGAATDGVLRGAKHLLP